MANLLENWWPLLVGALALYVFIACALVINTHDEDMPGGGVIAVVIRSALWPLVLALALVAIGVAAMGRAIVAFGQGERGKS